jgi:hypothetical protein
LRASNLPVGENFWVDVVLTVGRVSRALEDRVGMMIKLADTEKGAVAADGTVTKSLTPTDCESLDKAKAEARRARELKEHQVAKTLFNRLFYGTTSKVLVVSTLGSILILK